MPALKDPGHVTFGRHLHVMGDGVFANRDTVASLNTRLVGSAALAPGTYTFRLMTSGASRVEAFLKPTTVTGVCTCRLYKLALDEATQRGTNYNPDVALASGAMTRLSAADLGGEDAVYLELVVPGGGSLLFAAGTGVAEYLTL